MSERYATLFKCVVPQAQKNAPIILTAGVLLGDKQTGSVLAQVKMQNIGDRGITAVYASLMCVDAMNKAIEPAVDARYLDLNVKPGEYFADRQPIVIANTTVRSYTLRVTDIMFDDGTSWKSEEGTTFEKIPEFENAYTSEQLAQLRLETGKREFAFSEVQFGCIKRCYCGQWNIQSNHTCVKCHCDFLEIAAIADPVLLTQKYEERKKIEAEEAEQRRIEAERRRIETERKKEEARIAREKAAKEAAEAAALARAKAKKKAMILVPTLVILTAVLVFGGVMINKNNKYNLAVDYLKAQDFVNARTALSGLDGYKDTDILLKELEADELYANGDYAAAYDLYTKLPESYQIHEGEYAAKYENASELASNQNYEAAAAAFAELGNYKDSAEQFSSAAIAYNEKLASDYLNDGDYESARSIYVSIGNNDMATECQYLLATSQEATEPWLAYASYIELGEYKDSSIRAAALYGQRFETISTEDANGLRIYFDPEAQGYGLLDSKADVFVEPLYSEIALNTNGAYTVYLSGKCGVLAKDGKCLLEPQYDAIYESIGIEGTPLYKVSRSEQKGLLHIDGTILIPVEYDEISVFSGIGESSYYQVKSGSKVGLLNADGTDFISTEYDVIKVVNGIGQSTYYQVELEKKTGLLNANGTIFLPVEYDDITLGTNEYFVMQNGQMGIVNIEGVTLVSPTYDDIETMGDGRYLVSKDHSYGVVDQSGNIIVGIDYDSITLENTGIYTTTVDFKYGIVAYDGTVVHEPNMQEIKAGSNDGKYLMFKQDGLYGFLDASTFEVVVAAEWKDATIMYDGYAYIYNNLDKWGVISASGKVIVSPTWGNIKYFEDCGCALRSSDGSSSRGSNQSYLMNSRGTLIADFSEYYESVDYLGNGCFTNRGGEMLYDATTSTAYSYTVNDRDVGGLRMLNNGLLAGYYRRGSSWSSPSCYGVIDSSIPKIISSVAWEEPITVLPCRNRCDEKYGWINEKGVDMIKATYDYIRPFTVNGYIVAANYNDRGNLVYLLIDAATGSIVAKDIKTEVEAINYYDEKAVDSISLHEKIIISLIDMGFGYESSEEFLAALLAEDDSTAEDLYYDTNHEYHSVVYEFWDDIEYDIDDGKLNTEEKVWNRIQKSMAN